MSDPAANAIRPRTRVDVRTMTSLAKLSAIA